MPKLLTACGACALVALASLSGVAARPEPAAGVETLAASQQNAIVQRHCAVCHSDAARNGGLSLERFDVAQAAPSLAAMMVSKLTQGVALATVQSTAHDERAAALVAARLGGGAIQAAGVPPPPASTVLSLATSLALQAGGAAEWHIAHSIDPRSKAAVIVASVLRELPSVRSDAVAASYRLVVTCDSGSGAGELQLAWAPSARTGVLSVAVDGRSPITIPVSGTEKMGNGLGGSGGLAAVRVIEATAVSHVRLPSRSLTFSKLFDGETVDFSFADLPASARQDLNGCFTGV